jgi:hypothetical protein
MDSLTQLLRGKTRPLAVGGALVSGAALAALADAYVSAVNQGVYGAMPALMMAPAASVSVCLALLPPTTATEPCMRVSVKAHHSQAVGQSLSWLLS